MDNNLDDSIRKCNFQRISNNRFVVNSSRFWRTELHPRFTDIFDENDFINVFELVNNNISFPFSSEIITELGTQLYNLFGFYRFAYIPTKDVNATNSFLSALYFILKDVLPQASYKYYNLDDDDFNLITNSGETVGKNTSKVNVNENNTKDSTDKSQNDILTENTFNNLTNATVSNTDDIVDDNLTTVSDVFLSPQNQGISPTNTNIKGEGVDGVNSSGGAGFTTNTNNVHTGTTTKTVNNINTAETQSTQNLRENNDISLSNEQSAKLEQGQFVENGAEKSDTYGETLDFNRGARLLDFLEVNSDRFFYEIIEILSSYILRVDIATGEREYNNCPIYD